MISIDDFLLFCDRTLDGMVSVIGDLSDAEVNWLPPLPEPNSVYQLVIHATAAAEYWTDHIVLGNPTNRDRDAEFVSEGSTEEARESIDHLRRLLHDRGPSLAAATEIAVAVERGSIAPEQWTVGAALIHVYEELAQHLGHMEITVDLVRSR